MNAIDLDCHPLIARAIDHAAVAGHCRAVARTNELAAPGLTRAARLHRARTIKLLRKLVRCV